MSIYDSERATTPEVLDSDAVAADRPLSSRLLRTLARNANFMRDASAIMLVDHWLSDPDGISLVALNDWKLLYIYPEIPSRPEHASAEVRLRAVISNTAVMQFSFRTEYDQVDVTATGTGSVQTITATLPLREKDKHSFSIWVRADPETTATAVGTPATWTDGSNSTVDSADGVTVTSQSWDSAELASGNYTLRWDQGDYSYYRPIIGSSGNRLLISPFLPNSILRVLSANSSTYTILNSGPTFEARSLIVRGVP